MKKEKKNNLYFFFYEIFERILMIFLLFLMVDFNFSTFFLNSNIITKNVLKIKTFFYCLNTRVIKCLFFCFDKFIFF